MHFFDDAAMNLRAPQFRLASGEARQQLDCVHLYRSESGDSALSQVSAVIE